MWQHAGLMLLLSAFFLSFPFIYAVIQVKLIHHFSNFYCWFSCWIHSEGCGFVKYSHRDMALAAINGLNGIYTMRVRSACFFYNVRFTEYNIKCHLFTSIFWTVQGCEQPLTVRFADPKRPRGDSRFFSCDHLSLWITCTFLALWMKFTK